MSQTSFWERLLQRCEPGLSLVARRSAAIRAMGWNGIIGKLALLGCWPIPFLPGPQSFQDRFSTVLRAALLAPVARFVPESAAMMVSEDLIGEFERAAYAA